MPPPPLSAGKLGLAEMLQALKDNVDLLTGIREGPIESLPPSASQTDIIAKINEVIVRLNF